MRLFHFVLTKVCLVQYKMPTVLWNNMLWNKKLILSYHFNFSVLILFVAVAATNDPCSSTFPGWQPFSEPETRAVAEFIMGHSAEWILYLTLHSYSQLWMAPWGYTTNPPHNYRQLVWNFVFSLTFEKNNKKRRDTSKVGVQDSLAITSTVMDWSCEVGVGTNIKLKSKV